MKNAFDGFINRLDTTETQRARRQVNGSFHTEKRREKDEKSNGIFRSCEIVTKCAVCIEKTQEERNRRNV